MSRATESTMQLSRRHFLKVLAGTAGALIVGIPFAEAVDAPVPPSMLGDTLYGLGAYVRIDADGNVVIGIRDPDTGTGTSTSLARIIADELDADWTRVSVVPLGLGVEDNNGQPRWVYGHQTSGLGDSIPAAWADLRGAGALARWLLMQAAARRLGVPADRLRCEEGHVVAPDGRRFDYGALAEAAAKIAPPDAPVPTKTPDRYTLIGQPAGEIDARAIVTGQTAYALDTYVAEALVAVLSHCPWPDGSVDSLDTTETLAVKGVVKVVQIKPEAGVPLGQTVRSPAVAVLAENTWAALQGRAKLKLHWKAGAQSESSAWFEQQATDVINDKSAQPTTRVRNDGDVDAAGKKASRRIEATYVQPWLAHATAEPMNCVVKLDKDRAVLVVPTQAPQQAWKVVQRLTGLSPAQIDIRVPRVGGGYGRRLDHDYVAEAVMLAKAVERPVKLLWTRDEDLTQDYYRSASVHKFSATLDGKRQIVGWNQRMASASALAQRGVPDDRLWTSEIDAHQLPAGLVPNLRSDWYSLPSAMLRGPSRGMPHVSNAFAVESFVDEIAYALKEDPLVTRLRLIGEPRMIPLGDGRTLDTGRLINVLKLVADRIEWKNWLRTVNGLGIACWHVDGAYVAHAVEASLQGNKLNIERVVCAVDVGRAINPMGLGGQVAGATLDALSAALNLSVSYKDSQVQQHNWKDYPLASMAQLPDTTDVIIVPGDRDPTGASFLGMPTAAPALANAVFRVSAVRVRRLPLLKEMLRML
ncbi:isoquinoline 1-oxidoreductase, beta subunit [Dyella jiangningensis]|uniref:xanthine dehydrogenase family protein molybdopterin-binding subunit n=3 Tax=Gammaproteobacteria TaxID=1236 RepID=UPI00087FAC5D|nr:molybdopterin cofactor-binding domain-containing protein [Dyella sp. AtDHG13]PXV54709.1 isoquinoline 1-oxidoreductase beta subunit [Dyella sp. AtDHG13]SDK87865.1 isoquinoline 1-oxidoreductase, beta subunit [Dyella jiangningensis]